MPTTISAAQLIKKRSEAQFVTVLACILSMGEPTKFRFEAPLRYWLRTHWCLMGCSWQQADDRAAQLIARAYEKLHVIRPMWEDGQPPIPDGNYIKSWFCKACGELLTSTKPGQMYCNRRCLSRAFERKKKRNLEQARRAVSKNAIAKWSAKQPEQTCETCGEKFRPKYPTPKPARFCSTKCRGSSSHSSGRSGLSARACPTQLGRTKHGARPTVTPTARPTGRRRRTGPHRATGLPPLRQFWN